jgi:hypothetical protein
MTDYRELKAARRTAYIAAYDYAIMLRESGYSPEARVQEIRELAQEIVAQFAH